MSHNASCGFSKLLLPIEFLVRVSSSRARRCQTHRTQVEPGRNSLSNFPRPLGRGTRATTVTPGPFGPPLARAQGREVTGVGRIVPPAHTAGHSPVTGYGSRDNVVMVPSVDSVHKIYKVVCIILEANVRHSFNNYHGSGTASGHTMAPQAPPRP